MHGDKPKFGRFEVWGACSRCGARVKYSTLARERLTGLLVCTKSSGRPVRPCLDPWPPVYDFQVTPDRSIEPPPEPLPVRWGLDDIWSVKAGIKTAIDDDARLKALLIPPTNDRSSASFTNYRSSLNQNQDRATLQYINAADYDGTFVPSNSVRENEPPDGIMPWTPPLPPPYFPPTPIPVPPVTPDWVPANAKIYIDLVGNRAWTEADGEVTIDTLLGSDPNTENGWDVSGYDPANLTVNGYVASDAVPALIGSARSMLLVGATMRVQWYMLDVTAGASIAALSADGADAIEFDLFNNDGRAVAKSWSGTLNNTIANIMNIAVGAINVFAITLTDTRADMAVNGSAAVAGLVGDSDRPAANPLVCAVVDGGYPNTQALQSITIYDPLPDTTGLSELSAVEGGGGPVVPDWVPANAKIYIDFVGGTPQGRAWTEADGAVAIDTLLGSDPNTENAWGPTSYDPANINAYGYDGGDTDPAFIGAALTKIIAGCTIRFEHTIPVAGAGGLFFYIVAANGNDAVYFEERAGPNTFAVGSYSGTAAYELNGVVNSGRNEVNGLAITATPTRGELAANGSAAGSVVFNSVDWPPGALVAALVSSGGADPAALQSITIYDPLPDTTGLSELSETGVSVVPDYVAKAVHFDGSTWLQNDNLIASSGPGISYSFWVKQGVMLTNSSLFDVLLPPLIDDNTLSSASIRTSGGASGFAQNVGSADFNNWLAGISPDNVFVPNVWLHVCGSFRTDQAAHSKIQTFFVNDVAITMTATDNDAAFSVNYSGMTVAMPDNPNVVATMVGDMADVRLWFGTYIDWSIDANRRNLISASGKPVDPAESTLSTPTIMFSGDASSFTVNQGTGGPFTHHGTLTDAGDAP